MGMFDFLKKKTIKSSIKARHDTAMADYNYLDRLIGEVNTIRKQVKFCEIDITKYACSYMPTKKTSFIGYKQGYSDHLEKTQKGMKESDKLRSTTKDYIRFIKNGDGELVQIESYKNGVLDCLFQVYWLENVRYLIPYSGEGGFIPTYIYATKYKENCVVEEYMVDGKQIVHETYSKTSNEQIDYNYINYVSGGNYPVREIRKGKFYLNPLTYVESYSDNWLNHRQV